MCPKSQHDLSTVVLSQITLKLIINGCVPNNSTTNTVVQHSIICESVPDDTGISPFWTCPNSKHDLFAVDVSQTTQYSLNWCCYLYEYVANYTTTTTTVGLLWTYPKSHQHHSTVDTSQISLTSIHCGHVPNLTNITSLLLMFPKPQLHHCCKSSFLCGYVDTLFTM